MVIPTRESPTLYHKTKERVDCRPSQHMRQGVAAAAVWPPPTKRIMGRSTLKGIYKGYRNGALDIVRLEISLR